MQIEKSVGFKPATESQVEELRSLSARYIELAKIQETSGFELTDAEQKKRIAFQDEIALAFKSNQAGTPITYGDYLDFKASLEDFMGQLEISNRLSDEIHKKNII